MGSRRPGRAPAALALLLLAVLAGLPPVITPARGGDRTESAPQTLLSSAPDFTGVGVDGKNYRLTELLKQGPVLIDFWTTWCQPCMLAMPKLQEVWQRHQAQDSRCWASRRTIKGRPPR